MTVLRLGLQDILKMLNEKCPWCGGPADAGMPDMMDYGCCCLKCNQDPKNREPNADWCYNCPIKKESNVPT